MFKYYTNVHYKFIETNNLIEKKYKSYNTLIIS
jgi:hypothetical protein